MRLRILILILCLISVCRPADASTILYRTDAQLIAVSERVVHARVTAQRTTRISPTSQRIFTVTTLAILEDFTGREGDTVEIWELGGALDGLSLYVGGQATFTVGEEVLVCLERGPLGLRTISMGFSKFTVVNTTTGRQLRRGLQADGAHLVGGALPAQERSLDEFRGLAASVLGRSSRVVAAPPATRIDAQPWTKLGGEPGTRWPEADTREPIKVYRNTSAPAPLVSGDGVAEIQIALAAWTNPSPASIALHYAGTAFEVAVDGGWSTIPDHSILITFEDPFNEMGSGVLALGGGHRGPGSGGTIGGVNYFAFLTGFVIVQNAAELPASFRQPLDFTRIITHEIGHAIGFDHTQVDGSVPNPTANIMYPSCCAASTPTPPQLGPDDLVGLNTVYPGTPSTGPTMALDKTVLRMGATISGNSLVMTTSSQVVRLTQTGSGTVTWTATSSRPWLQVSPTSGTGPATLTIGVTSSNVLPTNGVEDAAVILRFTGASNSPGPIVVRLALTLAGTSTLAFGAVDTPIDRTTGITGAIPVTGWALDDIEVTSVAVCRGPVTGESPGPDVLCGGANQFYLGPGLFLDNARPDVQTAFPTHPLSQRAGWGFMVLTNMLPDRGNGTYELYAYAHDREGRATLLARRVITCNNANATKPFGTIDSPTQGGTVSGTAYVNFGWALTPQPKIIPTDGSTITVLIDGVSKGAVSYNHHRQDVATAFPGLSNTHGAVGFKLIDTTTLTNGLHTISWVVSDDQGAREGLGSRFFNVMNSGAPLTTDTSLSASAMSRMAAPAISDAANGADGILQAPRIAQEIRGRRGWDLAAPLETYVPDVDGTVVVRTEEVNRVELRLGSGPGESSDGAATVARYGGYLRIGDTLAPLPSGATLDLETGVFTWAPGVGFVGAYDLTFVESNGTRATSRRDVRIIIGPKGSALIGPQVVIDRPFQQQDVAQPFLLAGWAVDLAAAQGTGVSTVHAWAYPLTGGAPIFLGAAPYGYPRPDVAAVHGEAFQNVGFGINVQGLPHGHYDIAVFPWSTEAAGFTAAKVVRITVR